MILLTKLDNSMLLLNIESVKYMEATPDTLIFFMNGDTVIVRESLDEVVQRVIQFKAKILEQAKVVTDKPGM